ncbi:MAG: hypothetical protein WC756_09575 [Taibaiella sp.]|jgi:hypothetical protein
MLRYITESPITSFKELDYFLNNTDAKISTHIKGFVNQLEQKRIEVPEIDIFERLDKELFFSKEELYRMKEVFRVKYPTANTNNVHISWKNLKEEIEGETEDFKVAYNFIHRYDNSNWFLTAQPGELAEYGKVGEFTNVTVSQDGFFDITSSGKQGYSGSLDSASGNLFDNNYFNAVKSNDPLLNDSAKRVKSCILPAHELKSMISHNLKSRKEDDFDLCFSSISDMVSDTAISLVTFPHTIAVFARHHTDGDCFDVGAAVITTLSFRGRAANFDSLCPPNCKRYFWPTNLMG